MPRPRTRTHNDRGACASRRRRRRRDGLGASAGCRRGNVIRRGTKVGSFTAVAVFALAAGGISAALLIPDGSGYPGNVIIAGHLQVEINHSDGTDLSLQNLAPGEHRVAYQLVTGDMRGVASADLGMTLFSADAHGAPGAEDTWRLFAENASLAVSVSSPEPANGIDWADGVCTPTLPFVALPAATFTHIADMAATRSDATSIPLGSFTGVALAGGVPLAGNDAICIKFDIGLDASAGNDVQAAAGGFSMSYALTQTAATS